MCLHKYRCDTSAFTLTKSQKKIIKKLNKFLVDGIADKSDVSNASQGEAEPQVSMDLSNSHPESNHPKNEFDIDKAKDIVMQTFKEKERISSSESPLLSLIGDSNAGCSEAEISHSQITESESLNAGNSSRKSSVTGPDACKPLRKKAKFMRMERKAQKLALANKIPDTLPKKAPKNVEKNLETLLNEVQGNSRHKLEVIFLN